MSHATIRFGTAAALPGRKAFGQLRVVQGRKRVALPVCVIHGARPGRHVVVLANQHGTELNGIESLRRFCETADPARMRGSVCAVLSCNPRAAMAGQPVWTEEDPRAAVTYDGPYNMNYNWPGRVGGRLVERVAHEIWSQAVMAPHRRADVVLDLHCHQNPTAVYAEDERVADLGVASGVRHIVITGFSEKLNTVNLACRRAGIPCMSLELSRQETFCPESIRDGAIAIENLLKFHGLLPGRLRLPAESAILDPWRDHRLAPRTFRLPSYRDYTARHDGLAVPHKQVYDIVRKGELVCSILDPYSGKVVENCRAPMSGGLYNYRTKGVLCAKGQNVFTLAVVRRVNPEVYVRRRMKREKSI
jgi:uncharacterized protein